MCLYTGWSEADAEETPAVFDQPMGRNGLTVRQFPLAQRGIARRVKSCPSLARALMRDMDSFDVVHIHSMWNWCVRQASDACRRRRKPYIVSVHGGLDPWLLNTKWPARSLYLRFIERPRLANAAATHFTTSAEAQLAESLQLPINCVVIGLGVEQTFLDSDSSREKVREELGLPRDAFIVAQVGRLDPVKAVDVLMRAWALARGEEDLLWLVGPGLPEKVANLRRLARELGINQVARFAGPVYGERRADIYAAADLVTLCSYKENFGLAAAEAMACGTPVLVSNGVNISRDVVQAGAGWTVHVDASAIAERLGYIRRLAPHERAKIGEAGRRFAHEEYVWRTVAERMLKVYAKACAPS